MAMELSSRCRIVERRTFLEVDADDTAQPSAPHRGRAWSDGQLTGSFSDCWLDSKDAGAESVDEASTHVSELDSDSDHHSGGHTSGSYADTDDEAEAPSSAPAVPSQMPQMMLIQMPFGCQMPQMPFGCQVLSSTGSAAQPYPGAAPREPAEERTTLVFKNMPLASTRSRLREGLDDQGFAGLYDFVYVRTNFKTMQSFGYGFVNFLSHDVAERARQHFHDSSVELLGPDAELEARLLDVSWTQPHQGLQVHIEHFRNSPLMHEGVPDEYKPLILRDGVRVPFPAPTKALAPPKELRRSIAAQAAASAV